MPLASSGGFNPLAPRQSASQQVMALRGSPPSVAVNPANVQRINPMFGRPGYSYARAVQTPQGGPVPKLSFGSGQTGGVDNRSTGAQAGGYLAENDYKPQGLEYANAVNDNGEFVPPKSIGVGYNGRHLVGTYDPHDFVMAQYTQSQRRSSAMWQQIGYPPQWRQLLNWQVVRRYNLLNTIAASRPISQNDYFLGYQVNPQNPSAGINPGYGSLGYG